MTTDYRHPDPAIAAWLADGPTVATLDSRRTIAAAVRRTGQRRSFGAIEVARQSRLLAAAALLIAVAALGIAAAGVRPGIVQSQPTAEPTSATSPRSTRVIERQERTITFTYAPVDGVRVASLVDPLAAMVVLTSQPFATFPRELPPGVHGITVAEVTAATRHGSVDPAAFVPFGRTAEAFMHGLGASADFTVEDLQPASVGVLPAWSGRVVPKAGRWSHIMIPSAAGRRDSVEFGNTNVTFVADLDGGLVLVQVWADTPATLSDWLPRAMPFVDSIRFEVQPGDP